MKTWINNYLAAQKRTVDSIPADAVASIIEVLRRAILGGEVVVDPGFHDEI